MVPLQEADRSRMISWWFLERNHPFIWADNPVKDMAHLWHRKWIGWWTRSLVGLCFCDRSKLLVGSWFTRKLVIAKQAGSSPEEQWWKTQDRTDEHGQKHIERPTLAILAAKKSFFSATFVSEQQSCPKWSRAHYANSQGKNAHHLTTCCEEFAISLY